MRISFHSLWLLLALLAALPAAAHPPGLSSLDITPAADGVRVLATFALQDIEAFAPLDSDLDAEVTDAEREAGKPAIAGLLAGQLRLQVDGRPLSPQGPGQVDYDSQNNAHVAFVYPPAAGRRLQVQSQFLDRLPAGHQQFLTIRDAGGKPLLEKMLARGDQSAGIELTPAAAGPAWPGVFADFFKLGVEHILTGYDHLLFLFALLAVTHSFWPALKIITSFTLAHSITLACAALNLIELPASIVEPVIAVTIIYVAVENVLRGGHPKGRQALTFGFGLIHGFGFASVLREMGIGSGTGGVLLPLLSFNLGIETGQICVAALVLPVVWWINNHVSFAPRLLKGCSLSVVAMGGYWLAERLLLV